MKTQKHRRKKKFGKYYLIRFGIVTAVMLALAARQLQNLWKADKRSASETEASHFSDEDIQDRITRAEESDIRVALAQITHNSSWVGTYGCIGYGAVLYQPNSDEFYVSSPVAIALVGQEGDYHRCICTDPNMVKKLEESHKYQSELTLHSIYYKNDSDKAYLEFVPAETFFTQLTSFEEFCWMNPYPPFIKHISGKPMTGEWVDLCPDGVEGWSKAVSPEAKESQAVFVDYYADESDSDTDEIPVPEGCGRLSLVFLTGSVHSPEIAELAEQIRTEYPQRRKGVRDAISYLRLRAQNDRISKEEREYAEVTNNADYVKKKTAEYEEEYQFIPAGIAAEWYNGVVSAKPETSFYTNVIDVTYRGEQWKLFLCRYTDLRLTFKYAHFAGFSVQVIFLLPAAALIALIWAVIGYLIYSRKYDIAEYRRALTGTLAHDLKTPLAVISGYAENLRDRTHPEKADSYAEGIMQNVQHMDEMIAGVLELSRTENGRRPAMEDSVDLTALLHEAFARSETELALRGLKLTESGTCTVRGNAGMLRQLAENLAANAVQHSTENGTVTVTAEGRRLTISNPYTGELHAKELCEPFVRGDSARGMHAGSGLGLSIVQNIASLNQMKCTVTAKDGVFTVTLKGKKPRR